MLMECTEIVYGPDRLQVRVKERELYDERVLETEEDGSFLSLIRLDPVSCSAYYSLDERISLHDFLVQSHLETRQACQFLHGLLDQVLKAMQSQPVLLSARTIFLSLRGDAFFFVRAPVHFRVWLKRQEELLHLYRELLDYFDPKASAVCGLLFLAANGRLETDALLQELETLFLSRNRLFGFCLKKDIPPYVRSKPLYPLRGDGMSGLKEKDDLVWTESEEEDTNTDPLNEEKTSFAACSPLFPRAEKAKPESFDGKLSPLDFSREESEGLPFDPFSDTSSKEKAHLLKLEPNPQGTDDSNPKKTEKRKKARKTRKDDPISHSVPESNTPFGGSVSLYGLEEPSALSVREEPLLTPYGSPHESPLTPRPLWPDSGAFNPSSQPDLSKREEQVSESAVQDQKPERSMTPKRNSSTSKSRKGAVPANPTVLLEELARPAFLDLEGKRLDLEGADIVVGRRADCPLVLIDPTISLTHARLTHTQGKWYIQDLKSTNGTWLNGKRVIRKMRLHDGMEIRLGSRTVIFHE